MQTCILVSRSYATRIVQANTLQGKLFRIPGPKTVFTLTQSVLSEYYKSVRLIASIRFKVGSYIRTAIMNSQASSKQNRLVEKNDLKKTKTKLASVGINFTLAYE